jgi:xanthine dehydrogenase accessory factor
MSPRSTSINFSDFPLDGCLQAPGESTIAILTGTEGPAYRPVGAALVVREGRVVAGSLSSGCIERDITLHAMDCLEKRRGRSLRYGRGSPFFDIRLPCGGALDVTIIPAPSFQALELMQTARSMRRTARVSVGLSGLSVVSQSDTQLELMLVPDIRFHVFGAGPEAAAFATLAAAAGYDVELFSPDGETLAAVHALNITRRPLTRSTTLEQVRFDRFSAVVLFFHDHEWEPAILAHAAASDAFYIGAQGSRQARLNRDEALARIAVPEDRISAIKGPIGLFLGSRDARSLAVSVLSEVVSCSSAIRQAAES